MKNSIFIILITTLAMVGLSFTLPVESVKVNSEKSEVTWKGYKVSGEHAGTIAVKEGTLDFEGDKLTGGSFSLDMTSIAVTDIQGAYAQKLAGHLMSEDFFGVEKFPTATFNITKVNSRGAEGDYKITGDITIKEQTKEIRFNAKVDKTAASAEIQLDRTDFDVRYGSGSFFENLGDKTIYDEFDLYVKLVLN